MADLSDTNAAQSVKIIGSDSTGTEQTPVLSTSAGALQVNLRDSSGNEVIYEQPTFSVYAQDIAIGSNKSMFSILNATGSGAKLKIREIKIINSEVATLTGVIADFRLLRITGHSVGTLLTNSPHDTAETINTSFTSRTGATITGESTTVLRRWQWSSDEWGSGTTDVESNDHAIQLSSSAYINNYPTKPFTLNPGEGFTIKQVTNSTAGSFDIMIICTEG